LFVVEWLYENQKERIVMSRKDKNEDNLENYLRYAKDAHGVPDDYEDWALDNGIKLPPKKKVTGKDEYDDSE